LVEAIVRFVKAKMRILFMVMGISREGFQRFVATRKKHRGSDLTGRTAGGFTCGDRGCDLTRVLAPFAIIHDND
jgi:hypothetical protein